MDDSRCTMHSDGFLFDFACPEEMVVDIRVIAHSLANVNRFNGHTRVPYSVAEHCVRMSYIEDGYPGEPLPNLLHDSAEAYLTDLCSPQKRNMYFGLGSDKSHLTFTPFKEVEYDVLRTIYKKLGLMYDSSTEAATKKADLLILGMEARDLLPPQVLKWQPYIDLIERAGPLLTEKIYPWGWQLAEMEYLNRFKELTNGKPKIV
ncbi:hypothetical protein LCGC14_1365080 [marine sediment metagenome]|uniref:HD domain-containing protein n=1 Tax=marine sediment metagenome TaxID=412755 RepID=A0A0F9KT31_9ZZZZ